MVATPMVDYIGSRTMVRTGMEPGRAERSPRGSAGVHPAAPGQDGPRPAAEHQSRPTGFRKISRLHDYSWTESRPSEGGRQNVCEIARPSGGCSPTSDERSRPSGDVLVGNDRSLQQFGDGCSSDGGSRLHGHYDTVRSDGNVSGMGGKRSRPSSDDGCIDYSLPSNKRSRPDIDCSKRTCREISQTHIPETLKNAGDLQSQGDFPLCHSESQPCSQGIGAPEQSNNAQLYQGKYQSYRKVPLLSSTGPMIQRRESTQHTGEFQSHDKESKSCSGELHPCNRQSTLYSGESHSHTRETQACNKESNSCIGEFQQHTGQSKPYSRGPQSYNGEFHRYIGEHQTYSGKTRSYTRESQLHRGDSWLNNGESQPYIGVSLSYSRESQPYRGESQPCSQESQPYTQESKPCSQDSQPCSQESQPCSRESQPCNREFQPYRQESQPRSEKSQQFRGESQPCNRESQPCNEESQPNTWESQLSRRESQSCSEESQPYIQESKSRSKETQPCSEKSHLYIRETQSRSKATQPCSEDSQQHIKESSSHSREMQPHDEESLPRIRETQSRSRETQPCSEESLPYIRLSWSRSRETQSHNGETQSCSEESQRFSGESQRCGVCESPTWGTYYGAVVCLPCKTFFSRYYMNHGLYVCRQGDGKCSLQQNNRVACKACRLNKCIEVGMNRRERPDKCVPKAGEKLCTVCGDFANGIHFGVFTCEGCKKFFLRSLKEHHTYICKKGGRCKLTPRTRNVCRLCRYHRCIKAGMCREAIQYGRRKRLDSNGSSGDEFEEEDEQLDEEVDEEKFSLSLSTGTSPGGSDMGDNIDTVDSTGVQETAPSSSSSNSPSSSSYSSDSGYHPLEEDKDNRGVSPSSDPVKISQIDPEGVEDTPNQLKASPSSDLLTIARIDSLKKDISCKEEQGGKVTMEDAGLDLTRWSQVLWDQSSSTTSYPEMVPEVTQYWITSIPPAARPLTTADHHLLTTLSRQRPRQRHHCQWLLSHTSQQVLEKRESNQMIKDLEDFVIFAKALPGFDKIIPEDQYTLIRLGAVECRFLTAAVYGQLDGDAADRKPAKKGTSLSQQQEVFFRQVSRLFLAEQLDKSEHDLMLVICLVAIDRPKLRDPATISALREQYVDILAAYIHDKHGDLEADARMSRLFSLMPLTRLLGRWHYNLLQDVRCSVDQKLFPEIAEAPLKTAEEEGGDDQQPTDLTKETRCYSCETV